jgi:hypothetical protein
MAAGEWQFPNSARTNLLNGTFDIDSDTWKVVLLTSASNIGAGSTTYAGLTGEVSQTNTGYTTGGAAITLTLSGTTTVTVDIQSDPQWVAGSAGITARWAAIVENGGNVLCYALLEDPAADVTVTEGNTFTLRAHASGVITLS